MGGGFEGLTYCEIISFFWPHLRGLSGCWQTQPLPKDQIKYLGAEAETMACLCLTKNSRYGGDQEICTKRKTKTKEQQAR